MQSSNEERRQTFCIYFSSWGPEEGLTHTEGIMEKGRMNVLEVIRAKPECTIRKPQGCMGWNAINICWFHHWQTRHTTHKTTNANEFSFSCTGKSGSKLNMEWVLLKVWHGSQQTTWSGTYSSTVCIIWQFWSILPKSIEDWGILVFHMIITVYYCMGDEIVELQIMLIWPLTEIKDRSTQTDNQNVMNA